MSQTKIINKNPLQIKLYGINAGWLTISIDFGNEQILADTSYCMGDNFNDLLAAVCKMHPEYEEWEETNVKIEDEKIKAAKHSEFETVYVPRKATLSWDEEGSIVDWTFEREPTEETDFDLHITIDIYRKKNEKHHYTVRYRDFCHALAKACTDMLKKQGLTGYYKGYLRNELSIQKILFIKAVALNDFRALNITEEKDENDEKYPKSDIYKELEFLLQDI